MGEYNPHYPRIIGQEWVPIRDTDLSYSPIINAFERGSSFRLLQNRQVRDARFYTHDLNAAPSLLAFLAAVYTKGTERDSGPIREVIIPVSNVGTTAGSSSITIINGDQIGGSATDALTYPGDNHYILIDPSATITQSTTVTMGFNMNPYMQLLTNKRILDVQILYAGNAYLGNEQLPVTEWADKTVLAGLDVVSDISPIGSVTYGSLLPGLPVPGSSPQIAMISLGEVMDPFINTNGLTPWRFVDLQRFQPFAANRLLVRFFHNFGNASSVVLDNLKLTYDYVAMRILFCEEQRLMTAGMMNRYFASQNNYSLNLGTNVATMRAIQTQTADPVLVAGDYTVTLSAPNIGNRQQTSTNIPSVAYPLLNENRELYSIPTHPGIQVSIPFPVEEHVGQTFSSASTHLLPQVTLHASGGPLTEPHVYGRQAVAQVYGSLTATQEIQDGLAGQTTSWPWVRFYARRFGDTTRSLLLDSPSIGGSSVTLTPADFDALDEIVDGWKEVTLRFSSPPMMGSGTQPQWRWSASGEAAGDRWEVLGATAPALSGLPASYLTLTPSPNQLSIATYGQPVSGSSINLGWIPQYAPFVTATVDDQTSDAVLIFAQDMPSLSGFTVAGTNQALTGIGLDCGINPCCIPSALRYNTLSWTPFSAATVTDTFERTTASSWGSADTGQAYVLSGGASSFSVGSGEGTISLNSVGAPRYATLAVAQADVDITIDKMVLGGGITPAGAPITIGLVARYVDNINWYSARLVHNTNNTTQLELDKMVAGTRTVLTTSVALPNVTPGGTAFAMRFQVIGTMLRAKAWDRNGGFGVQPNAWTVVAYDTSFTAAGNIGVLFNLEPSNSNTLPVTSNWDGLTQTRLTTDPDSFGYFELQRMDTVDTDWNTIMKATSSYVSGFNDYEARVGILSSYRLRAVDVLNFEGPWSSTTTITMASPGASGGCISAGHIMMFTTNEVQDGSSNLAYSNAWETGRIEEVFSFPEPNFVQLQAMYNRDFFTAFRPTERGGEQFSREVLVQAAAISPQSLADFSSLRDMAWENVSYICVRDEDGNRWFTTVLVPSGRVLRDRRLYIAQVQIIEVTDTPSEVNP